MKKVNITISESTEKQIRDLFETQKSGLEMAVDSYLVLRKGVLKSIKGVFTREEIISLLDIHNGTMMDARFTRPEMMAAHMEDAENYEGTCQRHGADLETLKKKIIGLSHPQSLYLSQECYRFWYCDLYGQDLDGFVGELVGEKM